MRLRWRLRISWIVGCLTLLNVQITSQTPSTTDILPSKKAQARTLLREAQALAFKVSDRFQQDALLNAVGSTKPLSQWQRVVMLSKTGKFRAARSQALRMRPDSITNNERGAALQALASLQTKAEGADGVKPWAKTFSNASDRAYLMLGIAEGLLGIDAAKLPYSAVMIH